MSAWDLLNTPEKREARKYEQANATEGTDDIALFPLTIPFTTGPGTIAVSVALWAGHTRSFPGHTQAFSDACWFYLGMTVAACALALVIWITYGSADRVARMMGPTGSRTVTRLAAFLLLCIGVQILITGVEDVLGPLLAPH